MRRKRRKQIPWNGHSAVRHGNQLTRGERAADVTRNRMGSWGFVITFLVFMALWAGANSVLHLASSGSKHGFDPYPYILLNLMLSMMAGLQGAILLISAKRSDSISAAIALHTEKTADEIKSLLEKNTALTVEVKTNTDMLEEIHRHVSALTPDAGTMDPVPAPKPKVARPRKKKTI